MVALIVLAFGVGIIAGILIGRKSFYEAGFFDIDVGESEEDKDIYTLHLKDEPEELMQHSKVSLLIKIRRNNSSYNRTNN